jgi:ATP-binding cassette subfamily B protein
VCVGKIASGTPLRSLQTRSAVDPRRSGSGWGWGWGWGWGSGWGWGPAERVGFLTAARWLASRMLQKITAFRESLAHVPRTLALVWASSRGMTLLLGVLTLFSAGVPLGIAWVGKLIVDAVVAHDTERAIELVAIELGLVALQAGIGRALSLLWQLLGSRLSIDINVAILEKARQLDLRHFEDPTFYDQLTRARREASSRPLSVVTDTFGLFQNALTLLGYIGLLVQFSAWVVLGLVVAAIPAAVVEMVYSRKAFRLRNWRSPDTRRLNYIEYVLANDRHAKEVMLFGLGPHLLDRYRTFAERFYQEDRALAVRRSGAAYALSLLGTGAFYGCYAWMAFAAASGRLTIGELTLYLVAFRQGQGAFQSILGAIGGMYEDNLYMSNLFAFLGIPTERPQAPPAALRDEKGIRFDDVGFRYPGSDKWALRHVDLFVPAGQSLALVGHNGAGKTTFIKLLTRLYEPTEGRILLDGKDLRLWSEEELRQRIGVIFQDFNQYQFTVRENVGFGSLPDLADDVRLGRAVHSGGAEEVVSGLPAGVETPLGRWFQEGVELSGGQWQKIALARAFMREQADILVLDEPTAALDAEAEHAVFERFRQLAKGRTTIVISHRFPTVRMADQIVVLEGGQVQEAGTHEELVGRGERYAQLFRLQAQGYL